MTRIPAGRFKDQWLRILDRVATTRDSVVVTKRDTPRRRLDDTLAGSILGEHGDPSGTEESWDADRS